MSEQTNDKQGKTCRIIAQRCDKYLLVSGSADESKYYIVTNPIGSVNDEKIVSIDEAREFIDSENKDKKLEDLLLAAEQYRLKAVNTDFHRFNSWDLCYSCFGLAFKEWSAATDLKREKFTESLALNLFAYLASWGMLRNSFLLQRNYQYHKGLVPILMEYKKLRGLDCNEMVKHTTEVMKLKDKIIGYYHGTRHETGTKSWDTRVSKIMLGALGCVPAYDGYFKRALRLYYPKIKATFNEGSLKALCDLCREMKNRDGAPGHQKIFKEWNKYPDMKVLDMGLWCLGFGRSPDET
ncbi:MAG: hypothetical protein IJ228_09020 [Succinivibrio sp.]|nr:hypothetical protein [Succinivibrio sp.]